MGNEEANKIVNIITDDAILDAGQDLLELTVDELSNNELIERLPIVGLAIAAGKTLYGIREIQFARKILVLLQEIKNVDEYKRANFKKQFEDSKKQYAAGRVILELIDKASNEEKARIIGKLFALHLSNSIKYTDFITMAEMINASYTSDLSYFFQEKSFSIADDAAERLKNQGFYSQNYKRFGDTLMTEEAIYRSVYGDVIYKAVVLQ